MRRFQSAQELSGVHSVTPHGLVGSAAPEKS
jgi:hypothetical protein